MEKPRSRFSIFHFPFSIPEQSVPCIIEYSLMVDRLRSRGLKSLYPNGGSFGFPADVQVHAIGWIGPDDPSIRAELVSKVRRVKSPYESNLAKLMRTVWQSHLAGPLWVMPVSHWAFEL